MRWQKYTLMLQPKVIRRSACAVVIKEESERHVFTHDLES